MTTLFSSNIKRSIYLGILLLFPFFGVVSSPLPQSFHTFPEQASYQNPVDDTAAIIEKIRYADYNMTNYPDSCQNLLYAALNESKEINYAKGRILALQKLSHHYLDQGKHEESIHALRQAIIYCENDTNTHYHLPILYSSLATLFQVQSEYSKAMGFYLKAIMLAQKNLVSTGLDYTYANIAGIFNIFGKSELALWYLKKAEEIALEEKHMNTLESAMLNRGIILMSQEKTDEAMQHFQNSLAIGRKYNLSRAQHFALINIASLYLKMNEPERALSYATEALKIKQNIALAYTNEAGIVLGQILIQLKRYKAAEDTLLQTLDVARRLNISAQIANSSKGLAQVYASTGRYYQAYSLHQLFVRLQDSVKSMEIRQTINQLEIKFHLAEKDKELYRQQLLIYQQQQRIDRKNMVIIGTMTGAGALIILLVTFYRNRRHRQQIVQLKAMMKGEEKERNRIGRELHDGLGGMLTAINMTLGAIQKRHQQLPAMKDLDTVTHMLQDMGAEIRKTSHNLMPDILLRHGFRETLRMYCDQINSGSQTQIHLQCYGDFDHIDRSFAFSLYRILQELIQNIIKHAEAQSAVIQIRQYQQQLTISVEDDGKGFDTHAQHNGAGLQNIHSRVQALGGHISLESAKNRGTTVYMEFDLEKLTTAENGSKTSKSALNVQH